MIVLKDIFDFVDCFFDLCDYFNFLDFLLKILDFLDIGFQSMCEFCVERWRGATLSREDLSLVDFYFF